MPPATITSWSPARIMASAISTARMLDAHTLLTVSAGTSIGSPAPMAACLAGAWPAPPCRTCPMMAYSTSPSSTPTRSSARADGDRSQLGRLPGRKPAAELPERRADCGDDDRAHNDAESTDPRFTRTVFQRCTWHADTQTVSRLRTTLLGTLVALVAAVAPAAAVTDGSGTREISSRAALGRGIVSEINALRAKHGLPRLVVSAQLATAARTHSRRMALAGFFAHESENGTPFGDRVRRYYRSAGFRSWRAGENLLWASPDIDAKRARPDVARQPRPPPHPPHARLA